MNLLRITHLNILISVLILVKKQHTAKHSLPTSNSKHFPSFHKTFVPKAHNVWDYVTNNTYNNAKTKKNAGDSSRNAISNFSIRSRKRKCRNPRSNTDGYLLLRSSNTTYLCNWCRSGTNRWSKGLQQIQLRRSRYKQDSCELVWRLYFLNRCCNHTTLLLPLTSCLMNYNINKGIGRTVEFKGLKAQYLFIFAGGLLGMLILVMIMYMIGVNSFICIVLGTGSASLIVWQTFSLNQKYGEHGLMKIAANKRHPKYIICRKPIHRYLKKQPKQTTK